MEPLQLTGSQKFKTGLIALAFILFSIIILGITYLATSGISADKAVTLPYSLWLIVSYTAGLSMIFLPCTLPLAFVIIPLSMGKGYKKGLYMALLFGLGLTVTITAYGIVTAIAGNVIGLSGATRAMFLIGGGAALLFGLSELRLLPKMPIMSRQPEFIQKHGDYLKAFFLGLFLGNAGVGCPNPAFYWMLLEILGSGSVLYGATLGVVHGIGRATPLIFLSLLAIVGVNLTQKLVEKKITVAKLVGWSLVLFGAFILINGIPGGHDWYEDSVIPGGWNKIADKIGFIPEIDMEAHGHAEEPLQKFIPWILITLIALPIIAYLWKKPYSKGGGG